MSLRERLAALTDAWMTGPQGVPPVELAVAAARLALEEAALECGDETVSRAEYFNGSRKESYGCAYRIRALAAGLD